MRTGLPCYDPGYALAFTVAASLAIAPASARDPVHTERVEFARGTSSRIVRGAVRGLATKVHVIGAKAGQTLAVAFRSSNSANHFNVTAPGVDEAMFDGTTGGNSFSGEMPTSGDYKISVFLLPSAARRNETGNYTISVGLR
ncbi:DNA breaking-rejoining protein [Polymorphobacter glacialis]|uniref:DNA breaking-rejoining protein n=1 Tax=Sandarakinorhabdus glacialis TaxID=1614636 RepID=A0A916ZQ24_9SPHN|nr:DNA breaking-rejoining protein [Polymorphobacter glacialis]